MRNLFLFFIIISFLSAKLCLAAPVEGKPVIRLSRPAPQVDKSCFPLWITATTSSLSYVAAYLIRRYKNAEANWGAAGFTAAMFAVGGLQQTYKFFDQLTDCLNQALFNPDDAVLATQQ